MKLYSVFQKKRVVYREEIINYYKGNRQLADLNIHRLLKSGNALRIKSGVYYFKEPNELYNEHLTIDPLLIAGKVHPKGVLAFNTALRVTGDAYSSSHEYQIGLPDSEITIPKKFKLLNVTYLFTKMDLSFGLDGCIYKEVNIRYFSKERILLEGLMRQEKFFGITEFLNSVDGFSHINPENLLIMLLKYPVKTASMRLGWLLERNQNKWYVPEVILQKLERYRGISRLFLVPGQRNGNILVSRWNLMVPRALLHLEEY
ncbi:MAG: hypothetical protein H8D23_29415 [Candidatus Brocadiales bacterium]|nr:hypothetical protein [Candidatus Brocadiales bacterium]